MMFQSSPHNPAIDSRNREVSTRCPQCKRNSAEDAPGCRADHLMNDQGVGIRRVFELPKFPCPERICEVVPAEGLEPTTP
jgi:hypothetical protein